MLQCPLTFPSRPSVRAILAVGGLMQKRSYLGSVVVLTVAIWLLAAMTMLGPIMGDCLPGGGLSCPTDHERNLSLLLIALGAAGINIAAIWLLIHLWRDRS